MTHSSHRSTHRSLSAVGLLHRRADRTPERIKACLLFENLCERAFTTLDGKVRHERIVSTHDGFDRGMDRVRSANDEVRRLTARIGEEQFAILYFRIFQRDEFSEMERQGFGPARILGIRFVSALDAVARFYGVTAPSKVVEVMEATLATSGVR